MAASAGTNHSANSGASGASGANSAQQALMNELMNPNAWKSAIGLMMTVTGLVAKKEEQQAMENAIGQGKATEMQASATQEQATASIESAGAQAIGSAVTAASDIGQAGMNASVLKDTVAENNLYKGNLNNVRQPGVAAEGAAGQLDPQVVKTDHETRMSELDTKRSNIRALGEAFTEIGKAGSTLTQGFTGATNTLEQNISQMAQQVGGEFSQNQQNEQSVFTQLLQQNWGAVAVAAARG